MNKNEKRFDTSEVLSDEDYELIKNIKEMKRQLFDFINIEILIKNIIEIIDNSELVSFKNERVKKYIDKKRPLFHLTIDVNKAKEVKNKKKFVSDEDEASFYSNIIFDEVISKITEFIKKSIDTPECDKILDKDIFKDNDLEDLKKLNKLSIISTLYGMRLENEAKNNVVLEIMI